MIFTENSYLVQFYCKKIRQEVITVEDVPNISNLIEVVGGLLPQSK